MTSGSSCSILRLSRSDSPCHPDIREPSQRHYQNVPGRFLYSLGEPLINKAGTFGRMAVIRARRGGQTCSGPPPLRRIHPALRFFSYLTFTFFMCVFLGIDFTCVSIHFAPFFNFLFSQRGGHSAAGMARRAQRDRRGATGVARRARAYVTKPVTKKSACTGATLFD